MWTMSEATGWTFPPDVLLRQSEALMKDLATLSWRKQQIEEMLEPGVTLKGGSQREAQG